MAESGPAGLKAALSTAVAASDDELKAGFADLPEEARKKLTDAMNGLTNGYAPCAEPCEYETGGEVDTAIFVLHGVGLKGRNYIEGDCGPMKSPFFSSKALLESAGVQNARVILPSANLCSYPPLLAFLKAAGMSDGVTPAPAWFMGFDWTTPDAVACVAYIHSLIRKEISRGVAAERIFLIGHSQGGKAGCRSALTFPDAPLGGVVMLSSMAGEPTGDSDGSNIADGMSSMQKDMKVLAAHSPKDKIVNEALIERYQRLKDAVGESNFNNGKGIIEEDDNAPMFGFHAPFPPSIATHVGEFIKRVA